MFLVIIAQSRQGQKSYHVKYWLVAHLDNLSSDYRLAVLIIWTKRLFYYINVLVKTPTVTISPNNHHVPLSWEQTILNTRSCTSFIINFTWNSESALPLKKWLLMSGLPSGGRAGTTVITPICVFSRTFNHFPILHMASNGHQHHPTFPFSHVWAMMATFFVIAVFIGKWLWVGARGFGRLHIFISSILSLCISLIFQP